MSQEEKSNQSNKTCGCSPDERSQEAQTERAIEAGSGCGCGSGSRRQDSQGCCGGGGNPVPEENVEPRIMETTSDITIRNRLDHFLARWGYDREGHRVRPGLYRLGNPTPESPVFVTANYTLSFDALRGALSGIDAYLLVLNTFGINVWCAAGKGTFGTEELIRRIRHTRLEEVVRHRKIILPQLGAPGVDARAVREATGFGGVFGPILASDIPDYLRIGKATEAMRRVRFPIWERVVLIPMELMTALVPLLLLALLGQYGFVAAILAGVVGFPILLPWLPTANFSTKGFLLGAITAVPFALQSIGAPIVNANWFGFTMGMAQMVALPPVTAFLALNFTGSTPFPSRTGVKREMFRYIQPMAIFFGVGVGAIVILFILRLLGIAGKGS